VDQFVLGLARHGQQHHYELFGPTMQLAGLRRPFHQLPGGTSRLGVSDRRDLLDSLDEFQFTAWHDTQFDTYRPFALRDRARRSYPVTVVHHTLSYQESLHDKILRLLLNNPREFDSLICTSTAAQRVLRNLVAHVSERFNQSYGTKLAYKGRFDVIPLAVDTEQFRPGDMAAARARLGIPVDAFVMLWVGRLSAIDKADLLPLVQVLAELKEANPRRVLRLVLVGTQRPGEQFGDVLQDFAHQHNVAAELLIRSDIPTGIEQLYPAADVFVAPSDNLQESFGLAPIEAMACGVPQVVADWNGYRDTVAHEQTGFTVPTYTGRCWDDVSAGALLTDAPFDHLVLAQSVVVDPQALQRALQQLIDHPELRTKMATASRQRAVDNYSWRVVIEKHEQLWTELAAQAGQAPQTATGPRYDDPDYGGVFAGHPSAVLPQETEIMLTALGRRLVTGEVGFPFYYNEDWRYLDVELIKRVLTGVVKMDAKGQTLSIGRIIAVLTKNAANTDAAAVVFRHVLWLLKYRFLKKVDETTA